MHIQELTRRVKEAAKNRTPEERLQLLKDADILDEEGNFCKEYFSEETVAKDKEDAIRIAVRDSIKETQELNESIRDGSWKPTSYVDIITTK